MWVHLRAQRHAKWPKAVNSLSTLRESNPCCPTHCSPKPLSHWFVLRKTVYNSSYLAFLSPFFVCRIVVLGLLRSNIKTWHDITEILTVNLLSINLIHVDIEWIMKFSAVAWHRFRLLTYKGARRRPGRRLLLKLVLVKRKVRENKLSLLLRNAVPLVCYILRLKSCPDSMSAHIYQWRWNIFTSHNFCSILTESSSSSSAAYRPQKSENWELEI